MGGAAPAYLSRSLMVRILAYRQQAQAHGDLDRATLRVLDAAIGQGESASGSSPIAATLGPQSDFRPGTVLTPEYGGVLHRGMLGEQGFVWNGQTYVSLSKVARAITGTHWNGPRFFGLRQKGKVASGRRDDPARLRVVGRLDKKSPDKIAMLISAPRQPIATLRLGTPVAAQPAQRLPADGARCTDTKLRRVLTARQASSDGGQNTRPKIKRKRLGREGRPPSPVLVRYPTCISSATNSLCLCVLVLANTTFNWLRAVSREIFNSRAAINGGAPRAIMQASLASEGVR
jgi:hypothetical protein